MTDSQLTLESSLRPLVRRARAEVVARWLLMSAAVAAVWACAVLASGRIWTLPVVALIATGSAIPLAAGAVLSVVRRPSPLIAARTADRRLALAERLATAVSLGDGSTEIGERQRSDASSVARALRVGDVYPLRSLRWRALAVAAGVAVAVALAITTPSNALAAQRAASDHAAIQKAIAAISKQEQAAHRAATAQPDPTGALHQLDQALRDALAQLHKAQTPEQALETISQLGQQIQSLADPTLPSRLGAASAAGSAMTGSATLGQVAAALAQGNLSSAAASLRSVAGSLAQLTPAQAHQLATDPLRTRCSTPRAHSPPGTRPLRARRSARRQPSCSPRLRARRPLPVSRPLRTPLLRPRPVSPLLQTPRRAPVARAGRLGARPLEARRRARQRPPGTGMAIARAMATAAARAMATAAARAVGPGPEGVAGAVARGRRARADRAAARRRRMSSSSSPGPAISRSATPRASSWRPARTSRPRRCRRCSHSSRPSCCKPSTAVDLPPAIATLCVSTLRRCRAWAGEPRPGGRGAHRR